MSPTRSIDFPLNPTHNVGIDGGSKTPPAPRESADHTCGPYGATGDRAKRIADGGGLYLFVAPSGSKSWVLRTVVKGRRCDIGLGSVALVPLAEAREQAVGLRKIARTGGDPLAERRHERRPVPTFEAAARQVHAAHAPTFKSIKHRKQWLSSLTPIFAAFGAKRVDDVTTGDILTAISPQWLARPATSRRVFQRIRVIFEWSKAQGFYTGDNPTDGIRKVFRSTNGPSPLCGAAVSTGCRLP